MKSLHTGFRRARSSWLVPAMDSQKISKGQLPRKFTQRSSVSFSQAIPGVRQDSVRAAVPALQGTARLLIRTKWLKNTPGSLHKAGSQGCAVDWPPNMLHESDLYHYLAILQISLKSKQILKNLCVNYSEKNPAFGYIWPFLLLSIAVHRHQMVQFSTQQKRPSNIRNRVILSVWSNTVIL